MRKFLIICLLVAVCSTGAMAQSRAIGVRLGAVNEVSYQHYANGDDFWEFDGGLWGWNYFHLQATGLYNMVLASPNWTPEGEWNIYGGVGVSLGVYEYDYWNDNRNEYRDRIGCIVGLAGMIGLEYQFWFPLQLSVDFRPVIGPRFGDGVYFYGINRYSFFPTLSVRYLLD